MVHHRPPGTSKWNKIEHRLFSFISKNGQARPLIGYRAIPGSSPGIDLIGATTTQTGLTVRCELDPALYPKGIVVSDREMAGIDTEPNDVIVALCGHGFQRHITHGLGRVST